MTNEDAISRAGLLNNPMFHTWKKKDLVEAIKKAPSVPPQVVHGSPCDLCRHNPPSSFGGKPCSMCPAEAKMGGEDDAADSE